MLQAQQRVLSNLRAFVTTARFSLAALRGAGTASGTTATGVNYFKKGEDPPLKEDSEYPEWLWELAEPPPTLFNLQRKLGSAEVNDENFGEMKRLLKLENTKGVKDLNFMKAKK